MNDLTNRFYDLINKERNVYELATLYHQNRRKVSTYLDVLKDPRSDMDLNLEQNKLIGNKEYYIKNDIPNFTDNKLYSDEWNRLNSQFMNYHKSLSPYTILNATPTINYLSLKSEIGFSKNLKVLDVGGGTGHTYTSFFQYPETIDFFLVDPNLRLLHDQFIRIYPKLSFLKIAHILANAEYLPIKNNSFDLVLSIEAIDHLDDYKKFISESYRVLKPGGKFLLSSHLDKPKSKDDATRFIDKIFSNTFLERLSRYLFFKRHQVGSDDHTLHLENEKPLEIELKKQGFKILKQEVFKSYFFFVALKE